MANTFHVSVNVRSIPEAVEHARELLGVEAATLKRDYAKFEVQDPQLRALLGRERAAAGPGAARGVSCCVPSDGETA